MQAILIRTHTGARRQSVRKYLLLAWLTVALCVGPAHAGEPLRLAAASDLHHSGLLPELNRVFTEQTGIDVVTAAHSSEEALWLAESGRVDLVLTADPELEQAFIEAGHGSERHPVLHGDYVFVGSASDPARIGGVDSVGMVMRRIVLSRMPFVSFGDNSAAYRIELQAWAAGNLEPGVGRYATSGSDVRTLLERASGSQAYALVDRVGYLRNLDRIKLEILYAGDPMLQRPYHAIVVNPEAQAGTRLEQAQAYLDFITGAQAQQVIEEFRYQDEKVFKVKSEK